MMNSKTELEAALATLKITDLPPVAAFAVVAEILFALLGADQQDGADLEAG